MTQQTHKINTFSTGKRFREFGAVRSLAPFVIVDFCGAEKGCFTIKHLAFQLV